MPTRYKEGAYKLLADLLFRIATGRKGDCQAACGAYLGVMRTEGFPDAKAGHARKLALRSVPMPQFLLMRTRASKE
jgi:hypothetical protein